MKCNSCLKLGVIIFFMSFQFLWAQNWNTNFELAKETAHKTGNRILLVFQGSDWCAPCMKLERDIWQTQEFINFSNDHLVLFKADFPRKKAHQLSEEQQEINNQLAEKYNDQGYFPYVVLMDETGKVKGTFGYHKWSPKEYIDYINTLN